MAVACSPARQSHLTLILSRSNPIASNAPSFCPSLESGEVSGEQMELSSPASRPAHWRFPMHWGRQLARCRIAMPQACMSAQIPNGTIRAASRRRLALAAARSPQVADKSPDCSFQPWLHACLCLVDAGVPG